MKQTAVEWLMDKLPTIDKNDPYYEDIIQQAKAMEKEQISQAYTTGVEEDVYTNPLRTGEMYYNETYKP
jgi:hypothetical protein